MFLLRNHTHTQKNYVVVKKYIYSSFVENVKVHSISDLLFSKIKQNIYAMSLKDSDTSQIFTVLNFGSLSFSLYASVDTIYLSR